MKKVRLVLAVVFVCMITGCGSLAIATYGPELPENASTVVCFVGKTVGGSSRFFFPRSLDGISIDKKYTYALRVPAGRKSIITGDVSASQGNVIFNAKNVPIVYNFKAGKTYYVEPVVEGNATIKQNLLSSAKVTEGELKLFLYIFEVEIMYDEKDPDKFKGIKDFDKRFDIGPVAILDPGVFFK